MLSRTQRWDLLCWRKAYELMTCHFPQVEDMVNEVKFSDYVDNGQYVHEIDLGDFIKCKLIVYILNLCGKSHELFMCFGNSST